MKAKLLLFVILGHTCLCPLKAQKHQKLDSLLEIYQRQGEDSLKVKTLGLLYNLVLYNDVVQAKKYVLKALELSKKINYKQGIALSYYHMGIYFNNIDEVDSAKFYYDKSIQQYEEIGDLRGQTLGNHGKAILEYSQGNYDEALTILDKNIELLTDSTKLGIAYHLKGSIHNSMGNYRISLDETLKALKILEKTNNDIRLADALNQLASVEFYINNFKKSIEYNLRALTIYQENNDRYYECQALNDIGNAYFYLEEYGKAKEHFEKSIEIAQEMKIPDLEATALNNLGKTYVKSGQLERAIEMHKKSLGIVEKTKSASKVVEALNDLGMAYHVRGNAASAIGYFDKAILIADSIGMKNSLSTGYYQRALSYEKLNNYRAAYYDYQNYKAISDSVFNTTKSQQIEELRTIYETEKKEQEIALQKNEIALLAQKQKNTALQRTLSIAGLIFTLLVGGLGYYGIREKMKRNHLEKEKLDAELEFRKKELTTHALHLAKKNEVLESIKQKAKELKLADNGYGYQQLIQTINFDQQDDRQWENFTQYFEQVHKNFAFKVKDRYPEVTKNELRFMALIKMNMSSKEIATILNVSTDGIKKARQRLRKKLDLSPQDSLEATVLSL